MPDNDKARLPELYSPSTAGELLTPETISKLMLGFTAGLDWMAVAMQEASGERYDLWGEPERYWCRFCRHLRRELGREQVCVAWDKMVAQVLLGKLAEQYPGQAEEYKGVFRCHAGMLDLAEVINVAGRPLAILHGGQLVPKDDEAWFGLVQQRLAVPPLGLSQQEADELLYLALEEEKTMVTQAQLDTRVGLFRQFARELELLLNKLYIERRLASEEALLHAVASRLHLREAPTWETLWHSLKDLFGGLRTAIGSCQMDWFMGSEQDRFRLTPRTGAVQEWRDKTLSIGPFWEELGRQTGKTTGRRWDAFIRKTLGIPNGLCAVYPLVCVYGTPARNIPAMLVAVNEAKDLPLMDFLSRLATEIGRGVVAAIGEIEKKRMTEAIATQGAYVGHDMKTPLNVMVNVVPAIELYVKRTGMSDPKLQSLMGHLVGAVKSAQDKATELERMPVREFVVEPRLRKQDLVQMVDGIIALVGRLGAARRISVGWLAHPAEPILCELDRRYMEVALHAVFDNAVKYSFAGMEVRVSLEVEAGQTALLWVSNLGVGIPPDRKIAIFEFGTRGGVEDKHVERSGTGLGLPFAKRIIEAHKGSIGIASHSTHDPPAEPDNFLSHVVEVTIRLPLSRSV